MTFASRKFSITPTIKKAYFLYFGCKVGYQDKKWAPHMCCTTCSSKLNAQVNGKRRMPFGVPMVWGCLATTVLTVFFCMVPPIQNGLSMKKKSNFIWIHLQQFGLCLMAMDILFLNLRTILLCTYSDDEDSVSSNSEEQQPSASRDADYLPSTHSSNHKITKGELNDLIRDLGLPKK